MFYISDCMRKPSPKSFPKPSGAMAGQFGKRRRFFSRRGGTLPLCTGAFFPRGGPVFPRNPAGNGKHKSSHRGKKWEQCFIFRISWKFKPQGLSQTARSDGGTIWKAQKIFPPARVTLPLCTGAFFRRGGPFFSSIPNGMGIQNSHFFCKRWE